MTLTNFEKIIMRQTLTLTKDDLKGLKKIGKNAFAEMGITIEIPDTVTKIENKAFYHLAINGGAVNIESLPNQFIEIEDYAFDSAFIIRFPTEIKISKIGLGAFRESNLGGTRVINCNNAEIGSGAFRECLKLTNISIIGGLKSLPDNVFYGCTALISVSLPNGLESIGTTAFCNCSALTSIEIPKTVMTIGKRGLASLESGKIFQNCSKITELTIPSSVSLIGDQAFQGVGLTKITFEQPLGMEVSLPTAGSSTGMLYNKSAKSYEIYTDNETIKNYDWKTDNATVTLYHLDGTSWG